jgi:hypothetical protein
MEEQGAQFEAIPYSELAADTMELGLDRVSGFVQAG